MEMTVEIARAWLSSIFCRSDLRDALRAYIAAEEARLAEKARADKAEAQRDKAITLLEKAQDQTLAALARLDKAEAERYALAERVKRLEGLQEALRQLPPGPWEVWTSNSFRRIIGPDGRDGGVLCGVVLTSDGHPDLSMNEKQLLALCAVVNGVRAALAAEREGRE